MSNPWRCLKHPTVRAAYDRACEMVRFWWESESKNLPGSITQEAKDTLDACLFGWWPLATIAERIATEVLEAQGFDIEAMVDAVDAEMNESAVADLLALDWSKAAVEARSPREWPEGAR